MRIISVSKFYRNFHLWCPSNPFWDTHSSPWMAPGIFSSIFSIPARNFTDLKRAVEITCIWATKNSAENCLELVTSFSFTLYRRRAQNFSKSNSLFQIPHFRLIYRKRNVPQPIQEDSSELYWLQCIMTFVMDVGTNVSLGPLLLLSDKGEEAMH